MKQPIKFIGKSDICLTPLYSYIACNVYLFRYNLDQHHGLFFNHLFVLLNQASNSFHGHVIVFCVSFKIPLAGHLCSGKQGLCTYFTLARHLNTCLSNIQSLVYSHATTIKG